MFNDATIILSMSWSIYKLYWVKILRLRNYCISNTHRTREARHGTSCGDRPLSCCPSPRAFTGMPRSRKFDLFVCLCISSIIDISWMFLAMTKLILLFTFYRLKLTSITEKSTFLIAVKKYSLLLSY